MLVIDYRTAVRILDDPEHFPADPRTWQKNVAADCPVLPMMEWRPMATRSAGAEAARYRQQLASQYGAEIELRQNLIVNTLLRIFTDGRLGGGVLGGSLSTREALDDVLLNDPPLANYLLTYPRQPTLIDDARPPAHQPIVISIAVCDNDPTVRSDDRAGNRSHPAWGIGTRSCPGNHHHHPPTTPFTTHSTSLATDSNRALCGMNGQPDGSEAGHMADTDRESTGPGLPDHDPAKAGIRISGSPHVR